MRPRPAWKITKRPASYDQRRPASRYYQRLDQPVPAVSQIEVAEAVPDPPPYAVVRPARLERASDARGAKTR